MSGGLYGRGKAPERQCLPVDRWPEADRILWIKACTRGSILDDEVGARADHAEISNTKAAKGYGRWITYLAFHDPEALTLPPAERITRDRVIAYVEDLRGIGNASQTILARLQELAEVAKVMGPSVDWQFINKISSKVRATHRPARSKHHLKLTHVLVNLGFELMASATDPTSYRHAIAYRDGLIIAFLALDPIRRRNLADLVLGRTLLRQTSGWLIAFTEDDTKTHTVHEVPLPETLLAPVEAYLEVWRPILEARTGRWAKPANGALWVSKDGSPMTQMALYDRIRACTKAKWGTAINPHLFRDAAATTLSIVAPGHVRIAAPVLGHRSFGTTEKHYIQAQGYEAQRSFHDLIAGIREGGDGVS